MSQVPPPLAPFGQLSIREMLKKNLPPTPRSALTKKQRNNLLAYEKLVKKQLKDGTLSPDSIVICEPNRGFGKPYRPCMTVDVSPCLTTSLRYLFVLSAGDIHKPDHDREFSRWMLPYERLSLQGCEPAVATTLREGHLIQACGNAYPVNLIAACMLPILHALADSSALEPADAAPKTHKLQPREGALGLPDCHGFFQDGLKIKVTKEKPTSKKFPAKRPGMKSASKKPTVMKHALKLARAMKSTPQKPRAILQKPAAKTQ